jgi:hypothetical protein
MLSQRATVVVTTAWTELTPSFDISSIGLFANAAIEFAEYTEDGYDSNQSVPSQIPFYTETACQKIRIRAVSGSVSVNYTLLGFRSFRVGAIRWDEILLLVQNADSESVTSNHLASTKGTLLVTCSTADITITLPDATLNRGRLYNIKKVDQTAYSVLLVPDGSQTIDGELTGEIDTPNDNLTIQSDGSNWRIL